jgi:hypothetical protein
MRRTLENTKTPMAHGEHLEGRSPIRKGTCLKILQLGAIVKYLLKTSVLLTAPLLILFGHVFCPLAVLAQTMLPPSKQQMVGQSAISTTRTFPSVASGYLISFSRTANPSRPNLVSLTSLSTAQERQVSISWPSANPVTLLDATVLAGSSNILVAGTSTASTNAAAQNFVATIGPSGNILSTINLGPYTAERVCSASDGTFWTFGQQLAGEGIASGFAYDMLRNYRVDGTLRRSFLSRGTLGAQILDFHPGGSVFGRDTDYAAQSCGLESVGIFMGRPVRQWIEIDMATGNLQRWSVDALKGGSFTGLTLITKNAVFASVLMNPPPGNPSATPKRSLAVLDIHPADGGASWTPVADTGSQLIFVRLLGRDGTSLVHLRGPQTPAVTPVLYWSDVVK